MPSEKVRNVAIRYLAPGTKCLEDRIGGKIAERITENQTSRGLGKLPKGQSCLEVNKINGALPIQDGIEPGEPHDLCFCPSQ